MTGPELVKKLRETGTGETKLALVRERLKVRYEADGHVMSGDEALAVLVETGAPEGTLAKAESFLTTGTWSPATATPSTPIEDTLLAVSSVLSDSKTETSKAPAKK